jgi:hypothetical protein
MKMADKGMLNVATSRMINSPLLALAKIELPAMQIPVQKTRITVPHKYCHQKPSWRKFAQLPEWIPKFWVKQSTRPTAFMPVLKTEPK